MNKKIEEETSKVKVVDYTAEPFDTTQGKPPVVDKSESPENLPIDESSQQSSAENPAADTKEEGVIDLNSFQEKE